MSEPQTAPTGVWAGIARFTTTRARTVLLVAGVVSVISLVSVSRLRPVASIEAMLADDEPAAIALKRISQHFAGMEELLVLVSTPAGDNTSDTPGGDGENALLAFAARLSEKIAATPKLSSLCSTVQYRPAEDMRSFAESVVIANALYYVSDDALRGLADRLTPQQMSDQLNRTEESLSTPGAAGGAIAKAALRDPLALRDFLISALPRPGGGSGHTFAANDGYFSQDRRHLLIRLRGTTPSSNLDFADAFTNAITNASNEVNDADLDLAFTGAYAIAAAAQHSIRGDMIKSIVLSILFLQVLYLAVYRDIWTLPAALLPVALGILTALAVFSALGMSFTPITGVIGAILAGLGIDYAIHSLSHYRSDRANGLTHNDAIRDTLTDVAPALIAACATTVVGFLAIAQSSVRALREFGLLGAMGLVAALIATIFVLPAILSITAGKQRGLHPARSPNAPTTATRLRHVVNHRLAFLSAAVVIAMTAIGTTVVPAQHWSAFENDLTVMHPRPNKPLDTQHRLAKLFQASPDTLLIHLQAETPEALTVLAHHVDTRLDAIAPDLTPIVGSYGLADLLPNPLNADARHARLAQFDAEQMIEDFEAALEQSAFNPDAFEDYKTFLRQLVASSHPPDMAELLRYPALAETVLPANAGPREVPEAITAVITAEPLGDRAMRDTAIHAVRSALDGLPGATLTGITVIGHDTERTIRRDLKKLLSVAGSVVLLGLIAYFRSARAALLAMTPALFGFAILIACMRLFDLRLNTMNLIALPLLVGIGVDDGIFLVTIARKTHDGTIGMEKLIEKLGAGCHAVGMTSLTTMLTFGTLAFTSTPAIRSLGVIMFIGVTASLVGAIGVLVPLLVRRPDISSGKA